MLETPTNRAGLMNETLARWLIATLEATKWNCCFRCQRFVDRRSIQFHVSQLHAKIQLHSVRSWRIISRIDAASGNETSLVYWPWLNFENSLVYSSAEFSFHSKQMRWRVRWNHMFEHHAVITKRWSQVSIMSLVITSSDDVTHVALKGISQILRNFWYQVKCDSFFLWLNN